MWEKLKSTLLDDRIFWFLVIALLLIGAFILGRISVQISNDVRTDSARITLLRPSINSGTYTAPLASTTTGSVYASVQGSRYYSMECGAGTRIETENRLYFLSEEHARAAGYTASALCVFPDTI